MTLKKYVTEVRGKDMAYFRSLPEKEQQEWRAEQARLNREEQIRRAAEESAYDEPDNTDTEYWMQYMAEAGFPLDDVGEPIGW